MNVCLFKNLQSRRVVEGEDEFGGGGCWGWCQIRVRSLNCQWRQILTRVSSCRLHLQHNKKNHNFQTRLTRHNKCVSQNRSWSAPLRLTTPWQE